jgi:peptidoglycan-N-acetylglucosamine deacetylase
MRFIGGTSRVTVAVLLLALLIAGCAGNGDQVRAAPTTEQPTQIQPSTTTPSATANAESPSATPPPTPPPKLYRMNDVYDFVPLTETAPPNVVLLTFDDGPSDPPVLPSILDTLDKHDARAIFFINGYRAQPNPERLKLIADRGHVIGNHTWNHVNLQEQSAAEVRRQIADVQTLVAQTVGTPPRFFRPPFGAGNATVKGIVAELGLVYMTWSNGSLDWDGSTRGRPDLVIENVLRQLHPGASVLMHELPHTAQALDTLLTQLKQRGYGFIDPATIE